MRRARRCAVTAIAFATLLASWPQTPRRAAGPVAPPAPRSDRLRAPAANPSQTPQSVAPTPRPSAASARREEPAPEPRVGAFIPFFEEPSRGTDLARIARDLIDENRGRLGLSALPGELRLVREFDSLSGRHLRFEQTVNGVPVFGSEVSSHVASDGRPLLVQADVFPCEGVLAAPRISASRARAAALDWVRDDERPERAEWKAPRLLVLPEGRRGRLVWRVDVRTRSDSARVFVDAAEGEVVRADSLRVGANGTGSIYDPNPVVALRDASLKDGKDADTDTLTTARVLVVLPRLDGSGYLRGTWADTTKTSGRTQSALLNWGPVTRSDPAFEEVMAYFHVDRLQQRLQDLGITNANQEAQQVDAHALSEDQSYYDSYNDVLRFGDGGVDDAEDADIIRHEYGHAVQFDQVGDFGLTDEGAAMGEGFGDFLAAVDHAPDPLFEPLVGCWDAVSYAETSPPYLRRVDTSKHYPDGLRAEPHADGEIWSRLLWDLRALVGADDALRVVVESHFLLTPSARFTQGVNAILLANRSVRQGRDDVAIRDLIEERGFVYTVPLANPPADDAFEPNNDLDHPATLTPGSFPGLVSVDDDWFRLDVPPNRRFHVTLQYDPGAANLDMSLFAKTGPTVYTNDLVQTSEGVGPEESVDASAGPSGATYYLRVYDGAIGAHVASYALSVIDTDLVELVPGRSTLGSLTARAPAFFRVEVPAAKLGGKLRITSRPSRKRGAPADLRVVSPTGAVVVDFGQGARRGSRAKVLLEDPGSWILEIHSREAERGNVKLRATFR